MFHNPPQGGGWCNPRRGRQGMKRGAWEGRQVVTGVHGLFLNEEPLCRPCDTSDGVVAISSLLRVHASALVPALHCLSLCCTRVRTHTHTRTHTRKGYPGKVSSPPPDPPTQRRVPVVVLFPAEISNVRASPVSVRKYTRRAVRIHDCDLLSFVTTVFGREEGSVGRVPVERVRSGKTRKNWGHPRNFLRWF
jgi:hypothetical protein